MKAVNSTLSFFSFSFSGGDFNERKHTIIEGKGSSKIAKEKDNREVSFDLHRGR